MSPHWIWVILIVFVAGTLLKTLAKKKKKLPPGPRGLPILGHLHLLGKNPHQDLHTIAKEHGPLVQLRFGLNPIILVSSPEGAELFLKTHDLVFASRPPHEASRYISWDQTNISFGEYGPFWLDMRKLCALQLLSSQKISSFENIRRGEIGSLVESLKQAAKDRATVDLSNKIYSLAVEMSCKMVFGEKYKDKDTDFQSLVQEGMKVAALPNIADFFPFLGILDLQGLRKRFKVVHKGFNDYFDKVIDDHLMSVGQNKGIVATMVSIMQSGDRHFEFDRRHTKSIMLDMLAGSMDTAAGSVQWVLAELLKNPRVMRILQKELEQVVGLNRTVEEADLDRLQYLDMVVKETFRLHPVAPLLLPHYSTEDCTVNGYNIPKGTRIFINTYAIGRDPSVWTEPDMFIPERFVGNDIDIRGQHFQLLPFGSGRRSCPGMQLGILQVRLILAQLVHCFDWELPNGMSPKELDMTEEFGIVVTRAKHLMAVPTYRLKN